MTPRQKRYAQEFSVELNKTKAAENAGYAKKHAAQQGERLYRNVEIRAYIDKLLKERSERTQITADKVLTAIADIAFDEKEKKYNIIRCLELLGKSLSLFTDKIDISGGTTVKIIKKRFDGKNK